MTTVSFATAQEEQRSRLRRFRERLRAAARAKGLYSLREISRATGVTLNSLSNYMSGDRLPSVPVLMQLADGLDVTCDWLAGYTLTDSLTRCRRCIEIGVDKASKDGKADDGRP